MGWLRRSRGARGLCWEPGKWLGVSGCGTESGCVSMTSMCRRMNGGVKKCGFESCVEFCGSSGDQSGLCDGDADGVGGHGVDGGGADGVLDEMAVGEWNLLADPAGVDGGGLAVSASVEGCDGRAGGPVESGGTGAEVVAGAVCADVAAAAGVEGSGCVGSWSGVVAWSGCTTGGKTEKGCCCQTPCCGSHERVVVNCVGWLGGGGIGCW